uniref:Putative MAT1-1-10 protein n=1 Tax=Teratosphaeria destructans TaxID=418781 RepID=A0A6C0T7H1_9PEZI|nr:putative MAT1-1-10 protein [Teratosphaeria destructans]
MDILSVNFPQLRPGINAPKPKETDEEDNVEEDSVEEDSEATFGNYISPRNLIKRLSELETATWRDVRVDQPLTAENIANMLDEALPQLLTLLHHPEEFESEETRKVFFRRVGRILRGIRDGNKMWQATYSAIRDYEEQDDDKKLAEISLVKASSKAAPWSAWCQSLRPIADKEIVGLAKSEDTHILASEQHLPRGGLGIMGHWQLGVRRVVNGILEASFQNTVYINTPDLGANHPRDVTLCWTFAKPHEQLTPSHASVVDESIVSLSMLASRLRKAVVNTGPDYRGMAMQRWFSAPGLWAQREMLVWDPRAL